MVLNPTAVFELTYVGGRRSHDYFENSISLASASRDGQHGETQRPLMQPPEKTSREGTSIELDDQFLSASSERSMGSSAALFRPSSQISRQVVRSGGPDSPRAAEMRAPSLVRWVIRTHACRLGPLKNPDRRATLAETRRRHEDTKRIQIEKVWSCFTNWSRPQFLPSLTGTS